jgi:hypothetical protein
MNNAAATTHHPRTLRLRISSLSSDQSKVVLTLPVGLVSVAQRLGARLLPEHAAIDALLAEAAQAGSTYREWSDAANDERLELVIE